MTWLGLTMRMQNDKRPKIANWCVERSVEIFKTSMTKVQDKM